MARPVCPFTPEAAHGVSPNLFRATKWPERQNTQKEKCEMLCVIGLPYLHKTQLRKLFELVPCLLPFLLYRLDYGPTWVFTHWQDIPDWARCRKSWGQSEAPIWRQG